MIREEKKYVVESSRFGGGVYVLATGTGAGAAVGLEQPPDRVGQTAYFARREVDDLITALKKALDDIGPEVAA